MPHGRVKQYVGQHGWLSEDGVMDEMAAWMAAFDRVPRLTMREAQLAVFYMMREAHDSDYIAKRLSISQKRASTMMRKVRDARGHELPRAKVTGYY
jgi:hypothetical protein